MEELTHTEDIILEKQLFVCINFNKSRYILVTATCVDIVFTGFYWHNSREIYRRLTPFPLTFFISTNYFY